MRGARASRTMAARREDVHRSAKETAMQATATADSRRYARTIEASKRVRWDIDRDVLRGREFDFGKKFMPDGLSKVRELPFLAPAQARFFSQLQGRTYVNMFALVERYIGAKTIELSKVHALGDQVALEALIRFADEELKHQRLFRRLEGMAASGMPPGYAFVPDANEVADAVLAKCNWAVLAVTLDIELFSQAHYRASIEPDSELSELWKDVFLYHWKEESQHAIMDEIEWRAEDARLAPEQRDQGVADLVDLVRSVDGIVQSQAAADAAYFIGTAGPAYSVVERTLIEETLLRAYRWQYIVSGAQEPRFTEVLKALATPAQMERIGATITPIAQASS
jgi:hypothetical protein